MNGYRECLAYAEHIRAEHRELHQRLKALQAIFDEPIGETLDAQLRTRLLDACEKLREDLAHHFQEEEADGCVEYAVSLVPALAAEQADLEREHPRLLEQLDAILHELRHGQTSLPRADMQRRIDEFTVAMRMHEARENRIIERGFNVILD